LAIDARFDLKATLWLRTFGAVVAEASAGDFSGCCDRAVHHAVSVGLEERLRLERRLFHLAFAKGELHEGMRQFVARRSK
jgi:hypothetical protein